MGSVFSEEVYETTLRKLLVDMCSLRDQVIANSRKRLADLPLSSTSPEFKKSIDNLVNYLALRSQDLRPLQERLAAVGLSSLGRGEHDVLANIDRVIAMLSRALAPSDALVEPASYPESNITGGNILLKKRTAKLFGQEPAGRFVRIMVTLPTDAADNTKLVYNLLTAGMDCARINCAHDNQMVWAKMIDNVRQAAKRLNRECLIMMDLAGHKIRTGKLKREPAVRRIKVEKDIVGNIINPAIVQLFAESDALNLSKNLSRSVNQLIIPDALFNQLKEGDELRFNDARNKHRLIKITDGSKHKICMGQCYNNAYVASGLPVTHHRYTTDNKLILVGEYAFSQFKGAASVIKLYKQDKLLLTKAPVEGEPAKYDDFNAREIPAYIGCSFPQIIDQIKPGEMVWIDDGRLGATVERTTKEGVLLRVTQAGPKGVVVKEDKGLNFPDTALCLPPLSAKDITDLEFVCQNADIVGYSFVESSNDMDALIAKLKQMQAENLPIIAKIETQRAVRNLAEIILTTLGQHPFGIMIARGDLAVELGAERMAEVQEEILWICEAAHVPVIWATQVLESLAKKGVTSRPEITDAAMSVRAECVMLNKGDYVVNAVSVLDDILKRMQAHQHKKMSRLRALHF